jgi:hypothetical protein
MVAKGKFPLSFEPSEGASTVRSLIDAVQTLEASQVQLETLAETPEPVGG